MNYREGLPAVGIVLTKLVNDLWHSKSDLLEESRRLHLLAAAQKLESVCIRPENTTYDNTKERGAKAEEVLATLTKSVACQSDKRPYAEETAILCDLAGALINWQS
jgi:hypothetical protein